MTRTDNDFSKHLLFSDRADESVSNRSLLANAFEGVVQNDIERKRLQEYKSKIDLINAEEQKLRKLNEQIKELSFAKGPRDTKAIRDLQDEAKKTANRINIYDLNLIVVGLCLLFGFIVKKWVKDVDNKYIPTLVTVLGIVLAVWMNWGSVTAETVLGGGLSGLASTGLHQMFKQWIDNGGK